MYGRNQAGSPLGDAEQICSRVLELAREQLGMDVAWVSRFAGGSQTVDVVTGDASSFGVGRGTTFDYDDSYCSLVLAGRLPSIVRDTAIDAVTSSLPLTAEMGVGSYAGVPVIFDDGTLYGMMCCLGHDPNYDLDDRDVRLMRLLAQVVAEELARYEATARELLARRDRVEAVVQGEGLRMLFQPIVALTTGTVVGFEALARFSEEGPQRPERWFAEAGELGLRPELELAAADAALRSLPPLPPDVYLAINVSPEVIASEAFHDLLLDVDTGRIVVEVTEHAIIGDYGPLLAAAHRLREVGARLAVDDAGAGYASLQHILLLRPDIIKLDIGLTRGVHLDPAKQALVGALARFAGEQRATLVAEGVEEAAEARALASLEVQAGQGYFFGRPAPLP